jgi:hypothetical protein
MEGFQKAYRVLPMQSQTGDWEVYNNDTGETLEILRGYPNKGAAADAVYDKYVTDQGIPFNLRPADPDSPEKPLTKRERLAKNIKQAPAEEIKNWKVYDKQTGEVHYEQEGRKSSLVQIMRKFEKDNKLPQGRLAIEEIPLNADDLEIRPQELTKAADNTEPGDWEFYRTETGNVIDSVSNASKMQANAVRADIVRRYGHPDTSVGMRRIDQVQDISPDVAQNFNQAQQTSDQPPEGFMTKPPATGSYYEIKSNDKIYGYVPTIVAANVQRDMQKEVNQYIEELTGRDDVQWIRRNREQEPPRGFTTTRPAVGDYYEVKSGDRIYGYVSTSAALSTERSIAIEVKRYIEQLTGRDDAQLVYRAGDPVQARASNGVPLWEVYERESGHVVHTFADHDQTSAWATAQAWLRSISAEDPSKFSCRPKMES